METPFNIPVWDYLAFKTRIRDPNLDDKIRTDITSGLIEKIRETLDKEQSLDIQIFAPKGKGKSTLGLKIMEQRLKMKHEDAGYSPEDHFDFADIHFTTDSLEKYFRENPDKIRDRSILLDEQIRPWGVGSYISMQKLSVFNETLRKRKVNFIFASPSGRFMGQFQYDFMINPIALTQKHKQYGTVLLSGVFTTGMQLIGSIFTTQPSQYVMGEYDKLKEKALDLFTMLELNEEDKYNDVVDNIIEKYKMYDWFERIQIYKELKVADRKGVVQPPPLNKSIMKTLLTREPQKYSLTEMDTVADLITLKLAGVLFDAKDEGSSEE